MIPTLCDGLQNNDLVWITDQKENKIICRILYEPRFAGYILLDEKTNGFYNIYTHSVTKLTPQEEFLYMLESGVK